MRLIISRHAEAAPDFMNDDQRQLTVRGKSQAEEQGRRISELMPVVDIMAVSPLVRTQQTADLLAHGLMVKQRLGWDELVHAATAISAEAKITEYSCANMLVVSHMPLVASLTGYLCQADRFTGDVYGLAAFSVLESESLLPGGWRLLGHYPL